MGKIKKVKGTNKNGEKRINGNKKKSRNERKESRKIRDTA